MIDILYYIFIFPLQNLLEFFLNLFYKFSGNYGVSIVLLSLIVNLALLKLTILSEKKAAQIAILKASCDSKIAEFKRVFKGAQLQAYIRTLYKQRHFHPIYTLFGLGGLALQVPFFIAIWTLFGEFDGIVGAKFLWISDLNTPDRLFGLHLLPILMTAFTLLNVFISTNSRGARIQGTFIALIFLILLYNMPSALVLYWTINMLFALMRSFIKKSLQNSRLIAKQNTLANSAQIYQKITTFAILNGAFLICVFSPFALVKTDISQFEASQIYANCAVLFGVFLLSSVILCYLFSFLKGVKFRRILAFIFCLILFIGLAYSFVLVGDYGAMDHFTFQKPDDFIHPHNRVRRNVEFNIVLVLGLAFLIPAFKFAKIHLLNALKILLATLFIVSVFDFSKIIKDTNKALKELNLAQKSTENSTKAPYENELFSYSKTQKNVVVLVLDMFSGSHTPYILEQFPQIAEAFDGFTLFPNTISTGYATLHTISTLIGGEHYATYNMNERKEIIKDSIANAFINTGESFANSGFDVSFLSFIAPESPKYFSITNLAIFQNYYDQFLTKDELELKNKTSKYPNTSNKLLAFGLFKFSPETRIRQLIYDSSNWIFSSKLITRNVNAVTTISHASLLYAVTHLGNTNSKKPTFKFLHTSLTHYPYNVYFTNNECKYFNDKTAWDDYPHKVKMRETNVKQHYDAESCALYWLTQYIQWLKDNEIYDNTQIFVVSDHSIHDSINIPINDIPNGVDVILMFKDFNKKGQLKIDNRLMSNYDIPSIFCENLKNGCPNVPKNILKNYPQNREVIVTIPIVENIDENEWLIRKAYKVMGDPYDEKNWTDVSDKFANSPKVVD